jgi:acyl dehydratase
MPEPRLVERSMVAFLDNEDSDTISNPIHSTAVAKRFGFDGPLVGGVTLWGWSTPAILDALGEDWLGHGWAEFRFRRPIYPDDQVAIRLEGSDDGSFAHTMSNQDGVECVVGRVGLGDGPWVDEFTTPSNMTPGGPPEPKPDLVLDPELVGQEWVSEVVPASIEDLITYSSLSHRLDDPRFVGDGPRLHPAWIAARAEQIMRHNFSMPQSIHTDSRVQYLSPSYAGEPVTVGARCIDVFERNGRHLVRFDCLLRGADGVDIARLRHTTIFYLSIAGA